MIKLSEELLNFRPSLTEDASWAQQRLLEIKVKGQKLDANIQSHLQKLVGLRDRTEKSVKSLSSSVEQLRSNWMDFVKQLRNGKPSSDPGWLDDLRKWAALIDRCDYALNFVELGPRHLEKVRADFELVLELLGNQLEGICDNTFGNLISGSQIGLESDIQDLQHQGKMLQAWIQRFPESAPPPFNISRNPSIIRSGIIGFDSDDDRDDDPSDVPFISLEDVQFGMAHFGVDYQTASDHPIALSMSDGQSKSMSRKLVKHEKANVRIRGSGLSWIQTPNSLRSRNHMQVGSARFFLNRHGEPKVDTRYTPQQDATRCHDCPRLDEFYNVLSSMRKDIRHKCDHPNCYKWFVKFDKPYSSVSDLVVKPYIIDVYSANRARVLNHETSRDGFEVHVHGGEHKLTEIRVGYIAYLDQPQADIYSQHIDFEGTEKLCPTYIEWPRGKFHRRPAVALFLTSYDFDWHFRHEIKLRYVASREGIVIYPTTYDPHAFNSIGYEIFAVARDAV